MTSDGKRRGRRVDQKPVFGGATRRQLALELLGEDAAGPGPGAYLPSSTFGKYAKHQDKASKGPSSAFRSNSSQRPKTHNENVPGAGTYSPELTAIEPAAHNPASNLRAQGSRFGANTSWNSGSTENHVGPGAYDAHEHNTLRQIAAKQVQRKSRQNLGFGTATAAHILPHEEPLEELRDFPGPGKYETKTSEIAKANGHSSAFKTPTERKKGQPMVRHGAIPTGGKSRRGRKPSAGAGADGMVHV